MVKSSLSLDTDCLDHSSAWSTGLCLFWNLYCNTVKGAWRFRWARLWTSSSLEIVFSTLVGKLMYRMIWSAYHKWLKEKHIHINYSLRGKNIIASREMWNSVQSLACNRNKILLHVAVGEALHLIADVKLDTFCSEFWHIMYNHGGYFVFFFIY